MYYRAKSWVKKHVKEGSLLWSILRHAKNIAKYTITIKPGKLYAYIKREFFERNSIFIFEEELFMASLFPQKILEKTVALMKPVSVLDLGCGTGKALDYFISKGIDAIGVDGSKIAISKANHPERIVLHNLEKELDLNRKFDLIWSFEFAEHIHPRFLPFLLRTFSNHADRIVMSAAQPGQGGVGHFNEQPEIYWIKQFEKCGYKLNRAKTEELRAIDEQCAGNMMIFEKV